VSFRDSGYMYEYKPTDGVSGDDSLFKIFRNYASENAHRRTKIPFRA